MDILEWIPDFPVLRMRALHDAIVHILEPIAALENMSDALRLPYEARCGETDSFLGFLWAEMYTCHVLCMSHEHNSNAENTASASVFGLVVTCLHDSTHRTART